jgi:hypothetical protein
MITIGGVVPIVVERREWSASPQCRVPRTADDNLALAEFGGPSGRRGWRLSRPGVRLTTTPYPIILMRYGPMEGDHRCRRDFGYLPYPCGVSLMAE